MLTYSEQPAQEPLRIKATAAEELKKQERMRDVTLLLQQIVEREEVALRLIVDSLIDVGSINFANKKLHNPRLNKITKVLVGYVKPVARVVALFWLKRNLANLVAAWLESQVSFEPLPINEDEALTGKMETVKPPVDAPPPKNPIAVPPTLDELA